MNLINKIKNYNKLPEPVKASLWYTVCSVLQKGVALLATPIFTRLMTQEQYGEYSVFLSWYNILIIIATLNMYTGAYEKGLLLYEKDERSFTSSMLGLCTTLTTVVLAVYLLAIDFWTKLLDISPLLMGAMFLWLYTTPALQFWAARERFSYHYKKYVGITLATSILSIVIGIVSVISTEHKTEARAISDVMVKSLFYICFYGLLMSQGKKFFRKDYWKYGILFNLPLIPHYLSTFLLNQADRIMIDKMVGSGPAAIYSIAYTISTMMMLIITAINNSLVPYVYKAINGGTHKKVAKATQPLFLLVGVLCIITMCFAPEVIFVFAGPEYAEAIWVIPPIAASVYFIFVYSAFSTVGYYYQRTTNIALASCISAVANIILNFIFIKLFGYYAAGYTTLVCYMLLSLVHYLLYKKVLREELDNTKAIHDLRAIVMVGILVMVVMLIMLLTYKWFLVRYSLVLIATVVAVIKRRQLTAMLGALKK